jgi:protein Tex
MNFEHYLLENHNNIPLKSADTVITLASEGATIPFMARYRKEATGNLDEIQIKDVLDAKETWDTLIKRQAFITTEIEKQGKLTDDLKKKILACFESTKLEDLYLPYKQKKKTKATVAKEAGLEPLALWILEQANQKNRNTPLHTKAQEFINTDKKITDSTVAIQGAQNIITELATENIELREIVRNTLWKKAALKTAKTSDAKEHSKFEPYFEYKEPVPSLLKPENSHRYLALRRGWTEKELSLSFASVDDSQSYEDTLLKTYQTQYCPSPLEDDITTTVHLACKLALKVHVLASIQNEAHKKLKDAADDAAINVFSDNVKKLLLASPFGAKSILAIDPGLRTGCKVAVVNAESNFIEHDVFYLLQENEKIKSAQKLLALVKKHSIQGIAIGNGTASRETEDFVKMIFKSQKIKIPVVVVSESGASIYSASETAREEFPKLDLTVRGAISIGRRLQDPLAELVKVDPKSIGVGQYQHDVNQVALKKKLDFVVDLCVNSVGVNVNTASYNLLSHVSGIGPNLAKAIATYKQENGPFTSRKTLLKVPRFSKKVFEQAAGFLRIPQSKNPLDNTGVHPERYKLLEDFSKTLGKTVKDFLGDGVKTLEQSQDFKNQIDSFTYNDIIEELKKPGRDPRDAFEVFSFREDIHEMSDLKEGMICPGLVTNVTNFGAFVDIGVHQDGLVHISQLADSFVKDPKDVVSPGDKVKAKIISINPHKRQIALSLRMSETPTRDDRSQARQPNQDRSQKAHKPKPQKSFSNNPFANLGSQIKR